MFKNITKFSVLLVALFGFSSLQATPMHGKVLFSSTGDFIPEMSGPTIVGVAGIENWVPMSTATGFDDLTGVTGKTVNLNSPWLFSSFPDVLEWTITGVLVDGFFGDLEFRMDTGNEVDITDTVAGTDLGSGNSVDLWGKGRLLFTCIDGMGGALCSTQSSSSSTGVAEGDWNISSVQNSEQFQLVFNTVPAPATIGLIGLGLLGLGVSRRRKAAA